MRKTKDLLLRAITWLAAALTAMVAIVLIGYIAFRGAPHLKASLFAWQYTSENSSLLPALINTITMVVLTLAIAAPLGIGSAIYLTEYAPRGSRLVQTIRLTAETLSGIPSILYGLFGYLLFLVTLRWGYSVLSGAVTLAIMVLPLIMRTTEEALIAVPDSFREGSFALGAGKLRTVGRVLLPSAMPGILAGIILSVGRVVGETAALIFTAGTSAVVATSPMNSGRTLAVHMYALSSEGLHVNEAYATALVLIVIVAGINAFSTWLVKRASKG